MKRKFALFNLVLMALVQLTMAYQSFHYINHDHKHHHQKNEAKHFGHAGHEHSDDDDCAVCDFHFDFFVAPQEFCLSLHFAHTTIPYSFNAVAGADYYTGSLFALRAPPVSV